MADAPQDDELLLDQEAPEDEKSEGQDEGEQGSDKPGELGEDELEVTFGDEAAPASGERDTGLVKHLREQIRERDKRLAEAEQWKPKQIEVGPEPTMESCGYDEDEFKDEWRKWNGRKTEAERHNAQSNQADQQAREQWQRDLQSHEAKRAALKFPDVEEAEAVATAALNEVQQAVIVKVADDSAKLLYALGRHPAKLAELSQIKDPLKMAAAVARLEGGLKVMPKRRAPDPEEIASGNASASAGKNKELERLEKEADRTGDRTKLISYRRNLQKQAAR